VPYLGYGVSGEEGPRPFTPAGDALPPIERVPDETVIVLPPREYDCEAREEIIAGLQRLGPATLLFLRQIDEIAWKVEDGPSGVYLRGKPEYLSDTRMVGPRTGKHSYNALPPPAGGGGNGGEGASGSARRLSLL
jgi:hypothetical protein